MRTKCRDDKGGTRHPLPKSGEARHGEIPETLEREKGRGDDASEIIQPVKPPGSADGDAKDETLTAVNPDGEPYPVGNSRN